VLPPSFPYSRNCTVIQQLECHSDLVSGLPQSGVRWAIFSEEIRWPDSLRRVRCYGGVDVTAAISDFNIHYLIFPEEE